MDAPQPVPTGIEFVDDVTNGGLRPGLHLLAADPGAGKSAFSLFMAASMASRGLRVLFVSLEMDRGQCLARLASLLSTGPGMEPFAWSAWERMGREAKRRAEAGEDVSADLGIVALVKLRTDLPGLTVAHDAALRDASTLYGEIEAARACGCDAVVVDYLQLIEDGGAPNEYERVTAVSSSLAQAGVECGLPVWAISSVSNAASDGGTLKQTSFKGSGGLRFDAVTMWTLQRGGQLDGPGAHDVVLRCCKNRHGAFGTDREQCGYLFDGAHNRFERLPPASWAEDDA